MNADFVLHATELNDVTLEYKEAGLYLSPEECQVWIIFPEIAFRIFELKPVCDWNVTVEYYFMELEYVLSYI